MKERVRKTVLALLLCICMAVLYLPLPVFAFNCTNGEHNYKVTLTIAAGENTPGERKYVCQICGHTYTEEIAATGHVWSEWIVDVEPTDKASGHRYRICRKYPDMPHTQEEEIPPLANNIDSAVGVSGSAGRTSDSAEGASGSKTVSSKLPDISLEIPSNTPVKEGGDESKSIKGMDLDNGAVPQNDRTNIISEIAQLGQTEIENEDRSQAVQETTAAETEQQGLDEPDEEASGYASIEADINSSTNKKRTGGPLLKAFLLALLSVNEYDAISAIAMSGVLFWYVQVVEPMYAALVWMKKKQAEAVDKLKKKT